MKNSGEVLETEEKVEGNVVLRKGIFRKIAKLFKMVAGFNEECKLNGISY